MRTVAYSNGSAAAHQSLHALPCGQSPLKNPSVCINTHRRWTGREVIAVLRKAGWREVRQKGSHVQFKHATNPGRVTVPRHNGDLPIGTLKSIEKQAKIELR